MNALWFHVLHFFGIGNEAGYGYAFFSGIGSDIGEVALIGAVIGSYRHANCHIQKCWRIARHEYEMDGVKYRLCRLHHPKVSEDSRPTAADFTAHHESNFTKRKVTK